MERTACMLFASHPRSSLLAMIMGAVHRASALLLSRPDKVAPKGRDRNGLVVIRLPIVGDARVLLRANWLIDGGGSSNA